MKRNYFIYFYVFICFVLVIFSWYSVRKKTIPIQVKDLSEITVQLPDSNGVKLVQANCVTCHSLRYIQIQPNITKAAWKKIVKKMVVNYGAPIQDTNTVNQIITYLATIKGKK